MNKENLNKLFIFNGVKNINDLLQIKSVEPGELLTINLQQEYKFTSKSFKNNLSNNSRTENFEVLMLSYKNHLNADTSVDLFLSGGLDSSIIAYIIKNEA